MKDGKNFMGGWDKVITEQFKVIQTKEQTNEQWFCSLSTEEKAKRIINIAVNSNCDYKTIVEWLKEIHHAN